MGVFKEKTWESVSGAIPKNTKRTVAAAALLSKPHAQWYGLHLRQRFEKKAAAILRRKNFEIFLPLLRQTHRWSDRRKIVEVPLFPGYAFINLALQPKLKLEILQTPGVLGFAGAQHEPSAVPQTQIEDLHHLLRSNADCALLPFLHTGQRVRIRGGALDGIEGILQDKDRNHLIISIASIQRSVAVTIDGYSLELV